MKNGINQSGHNTIYAMDYSQVKIHQALDNAKLKNIHYANCIFNDLRLKCATIEDSSITQSIIENTYMRHATFKNCNFAGTKFIGCNLEKAKFIDCKFEYAKFSDCLLNINNISRTSFNNYNQKADFLYQLYKNELSIGKASNADKLFVQYKIAQTCFYKVCIMSYFKCHDTEISYYINETERIGFYQVLINYLSNTFFRIFFGFGIKFKTIFVSFSIVTTLFSLVYSFLLHGKDSYIPHTALMSLENIILSNISYVSMSKYSMTVIWIAHFENLVGLIYLSILTASIYGRISK